MKVLDTSIQSIGKLDKLEPSIKISVTIWISTSDALDELTPATSPLEFKSLNGFFLTKKLTPFLGILLLVAKHKSDTRVSLKREVAANFWIWKTTVFIITVGV
jgi:hypothetical protein